MKKLIALMSFALCFVFANAQDATSYQKPSKEIADLLLAPPTPTISVDGKKFLSNCRRTRTT